MANYDYSVRVKITLANGDVVERTITDWIEDVYNAEVAQNYLPQVVGDLVADWGCEKLDAPMDRVDILRIDYVRRRKYA